MQLLPQKYYNLINYKDYFDKNNTSAEIGYVINPAYWNKGYATEAGSMVIRLGFIELDLNRIEARHMIGNDSSGRVMEKCGMKFTHFSKAKAKFGSDELCDVKCYEMKKGIANE